MRSKIAALAVALALVSAMTSEIRADDAAARTAWDFSFTAIEGDRERLRALIQAQPARFLFGSDLVTTRAPGGPAETALEWDRQLAANLGLLEQARFDFWRHGARIGAFRLGSYHGLELGSPVIERVLAGNVRAWLGVYRHGP